MTRNPRAALAAAAAAGALAAWAVLVEPRRLVVSRRELRLPGWPPGLDGLRVALVADLHAGAPHMDADRVGAVAARVAAEQPDLVALLGDFVDPKVAGGRRVAPEAVAARLGSLSAPRGVFAVLGNHDWLTDGPRVARALAARGIRVLENEGVEAPAASANGPREPRPAPSGAGRAGTGGAERATPAGGPLWVAGLADARTRRPDVEAALARVPPRAAVLMLMHDPDVFPRMPAGVALTLAGHTHGGQVNLPGLRRLVIPSRHGTRFRAGHVEEGGRHLYVSRGVGTSGWPVRLLAPPEVVVLTLRATT